MWGAIAYGAFLVGSYVYHRWTAPEQPKPKPADSIEIPRTDEGATPPLFWGRCRVRSPILAWARTPAADAASNAGFWKYSMDMFMVVGIPFKHPTLVRLYQIWVGEVRLKAFLGSALANVGVQPGQGFIFSNPSDPFATQQGFIGDQMDLFDGNPSQQLVDPTAPFASTTNAGTAMIADGVAAEMIPGYRGYVSVFHHRGGGQQWALGESNNLGSYSYEVSSYPADSDATNIGLEANPAKVLIDILTAPFGKLGLPTSKLDLDSFASAKVRLSEEGNGYSRAITEAIDANQIVREICEQTDGVVFEDPHDGKIRYKLIRGDYDVSALLGVTTENCERLENFAAGGWEGVVNKVRVLFENRDDDYREGSGVAHSQASATGSDGEVREVVLRMPGVKTQTLANELAARELAARSRPIAKCRAIVDRTFHRVNPGDPIRVTWPEYGIDGRVFRVAAVDRGTLENGKIALELIEDFFYVWRNVVIPEHPVESFPGGGGVLEDP